MWTILCDFDGTVALKDTADAVFSRFADPAWQSVEDLWEQGKIGSAECMRRQVELIDASLPEIEAFLDTLPVDPYFSEFVEFCEASAIPLIIASDGVDYFIRHLLKRYGLPHLPVRANHLVQKGNRRYNLRSPDEGACKMQAGTCKCVLAEQDTRHTLLIGDGRSDFCLAHKVDMVFAKHRLLEYCISHTLPYQAFADFRDVQVLMQQLLSVEMPDITRPTALVVVGGIRRTLTGAQAN